jgi:hypothetical protein
VDIRVECVTPDGLSGKKRVWFRGIFHLIGILGESPFVSKLRKAESAQHSVQWTGGYAPRFQAFFSALGFFRFDSESQPTHLPLTLTVGRRAPPTGDVLVMAPYPVIGAALWST